MGYAAPGPGFILIESEIMKQMFLLHGNKMEIIAFARNEVAFTCRQIKQLIRFILENFHLNFATACELRYL